MRFRKIQPSAEWNRWIECYWMVEDESDVSVQQKIVPDGFPEIIFHSADNYRINISGTWERQEKSLLAGQIKKFFYLENEGRSGVFGVKLKPAAPALLFDIEMSLLTDRVVDLSQSIPLSSDWISSMRAASSIEEKISLTEKFLRPFTDRSDLRQLHPVEICIEGIFKGDGLTSIEDLTSGVNVGKRQLELYFKRYVGLSPKFFSRIVRFAKIFEIIQGENINWSDVVHLAGYYDQAHFIKNFKAFTGEEPGRYGFDRNDFANFFMRKG
jgi:AraC-like DNA-binding protein